MVLRASLDQLLGGLFVATASWVLAGCGSSQTNNLAPPPRPPDPAQITLAPIRVTRAAWTPPRRRPSPPRRHADVAVVAPRAAASR